MLDLFEREIELLITPYIVLLDSNRAVAHMLKDYFVDCTQENMSKLAVQVQIVI